MLKSWKVKNCLKQKACLGRWVCEWPGAHPPPLGHRPSSGALKKVKWRESWHSSLRRVWPHNTGRQSSRESQSPSNVNSSSGHSLIPSRSLRYMSGCVCLWRVASHTHTHLLGQSPETRKLCPSRSRHIPNKDGVGFGGWGGRKAAVFRAEQQPALEVTELHLWGQRYHTLHDTKTEERLFFRWGKALKISANFHQTIGSRNGRIQYVITIQAATMYLLSI